MVSPCKSSRGLSLQLVVPVRLFELSRRCILRIRLQGRKDGAPCGFGELQGNKNGRGCDVQEAEADRNEQQHEQEQDCRGERTGRLLTLTQTDRQSSLLQ